MILPNKVSRGGLFSTAVKLFNHGKQGINVKFTPNSLIDKTSLYVMLHRRSNLLWLFDHQQHYVKFFEKFSCKWHTYNTKKVNFFINIDLRCVVVNHGKKLFVQFVWTISVFTRNLRSWIIDFLFLCTSSG